MAEPDDIERYTSATLYAIGSYAPELASCMEYNNLFDDVPAGTSVCVAVANGFEEGVLELAEILRVDPWSPEQHHLEPSRIDASALDRAEFCAAETVERLRAAGFSFYFVLEAW